MELGPLLYQVQPRWQVFAAFGGALAVHALAVGIAGLKEEEPMADLSAIPEAVLGDFDRTGARAARASAARGGRAGAT